MFEIKYLLKNFQPVFGPLSILILIVLLSNSTNVFIIQISLENTWLKFFKTISYTLKYKRFVLIRVQNNSRSKSIFLWKILRFNKKKCFYKAHWWFRRKRGNKKSMFFALDLFIEYFECIARKVYTRVFWL